MNTPAYVKGAFAAALVVAASTLPAWAQTAAPAAPVSADCRAKRERPGYDVVLLAGQSNMVGFGLGFDAAIDAQPDPRIEQLALDSKRIVAAVEPLQHPGSVNRVGLGMSFARAYLQTLPSPRKLLLVPSAVGDTGFLERRWNPGDDLFESAVKRMNAALAQDAGNCVAALLWHQGEADAEQNATSVQYAAHLDRMIQGFRSRIANAAQAPFVLGQFVPDWTPGPKVSQRAVGAAISETPNRVALTAVVSSAGLSSNIRAGDRIHFDAAGQRELGRRYFDALSKLMATAPAPGR